MSARDEAIRIAELSAPFLAECMGSFFVTLTYGFNLLTGSLVWLSTSVAFAIMVSMASTVNVSGGHLNPAVTLAFALARKVSWLRAVGFWAAQLLGAMVAGFTVTRSLGAKIPVAPQGSFKAFDVGVVEVVFTSLMCFTALSCLASLRNNPRRRPNQFSSVAVGFVYVAGGQAAYQISGAIFNPALAAAYACTGPVEDWGWLGWYLLFHVMSAVIAAMLFFMLRPEELLVFGVGRLESEGLDWRRAAAVVCPSCFGDRRASGRVPARAGDVEDDEAMLAYLDKYRSPLPVRLLAEFLGAFCVVATYGLSVTGGKLAVKAIEAGTSRGGDHAHENADTSARLKQDAQNMEAAAHWATGAAVTSVTYALGDVSGAHFNPAITLAFALSQPGMWQMAECLLVMVAQVGGGVVAALLYLLPARGAGDYKLTTQELGPGPGHRLRAVLLGELAFSCAVAVVALSVTSVHSPRYARALNVRSFPFALAIGFCVAGGGLTIDSHTHGVLNPAITIGVSTADILGNSFDFAKYVPTLLYYVTWQMAGGFIASIVFVMTHPMEYKRDPLMV